MCSEATKTFSLFAAFACSDYKAKPDHSFENMAILNKNVEHTSALHILVEVSFLCVTCSIAIINKFRFKT